MDWDNVIADVTMLVPVHFNYGRSSSIGGIVLHHNAGNLTIEDCYNTWLIREASAHYQVQDDGVIGQLVNDCDTAWHAQNANPWTIGIEHANNNFGPWTISDACLESGAHLVAALCKYYNLGRPQWLVNVFPHSYFSATACPGEIAGSQNAAYMARAQAWYDAMMNGTDPGDAPSSQPSTPSYQPSVEGFDDFAGGSYTVNVDVLNVRDAPSVSGNVVAEYYRGETVNLDSWYTVVDGYVWGRYTSYSGNIRYIAVGPHTGSPESDDYLVKTGGVFVTDSNSSSVPSGTYQVIVDAVNVRSDPSTGASIVASYNNGETVNLDGWSTVADGYVWGRYTSYSGNTRYIAVREASGFDYLVLV